MEALNWVDGRSRQAFRDWNDMDLLEPRRTARNSRVIVDVDRWVSEIIGSSENQQVGCQIDWRKLCPPELSPHENPMACSPAHTRAVDNDENSHPLFSCLPVTCTTSLATMTYTRQGRSDYKRNGI